MQAVIYLGTLKIAKTKYGQFPRGKRADLPDVVAREVLKIPGFEEPTFPARYLGKAPSRSLQVQGGDIIVCSRGIWKALPVAIKYKIVKDTDFEVGPPGSSAKFLIAKQQREADARKRAERAKHRPASVPVIVAKPEVKPEVKFEAPTPVNIESLNLPARIVSNLKTAGIWTVADLPKGKKLLEIKGIGASSAKVIRREVEEA